MPGASRIGAPGSALAALRWVAFIRDRQDPHTRRAAGRPGCQRTGRECARQSGTRRALHGQRYGVPRRPRDARDRGGAHRPGRAASAPRAHARAGRRLDRYGAEVAATSEGLWHFAVEAWGDPVARWRHDAEIKVPIGQDVELMLTEGALLLERGAAQIRRVKELPAAQARLARTARATLTTAAGVAPRCRAAADGAARGRR